MINHTIQISVLYNCRVASSGYTIKKGKRTSKFTKKPRLLVPKDTNSHYRIKEFTQDTVNDFQSIIDLEPERLDEEARLWFCNRWGALQEENENYALFDDLRIQIKDYKIAKAKNKYKPFEISLSAKFITSNDGKQIPAIECINLYNAIKTSWFLSFQHEMEVTMCKYFKVYGQRKNCNKYFPKKGIKEFCSNDCRSRYYQKEN